MQYVNAIPASPEVINQEGKVLQGLYRLAAYTQRKRDFAHLTSGLARLADDPERALRVALVWAEQACAPVRASFNLSDPDAGIYLQSLEDGDPEEGELVAGRFLNFVLRGRTDVAVSIFEELVRWFGTEDLKVFLSLMVAISCNT